MLVTTGSALKTGIAALAAATPLVLGGFLGGVVVDRVGPRRASILADLASGLAIAAIPLLHAVERLGFAHVLVFAFASALLDAPGQSARQALIPDLSRRAGVPLERATSLWTSTEHAAYVLGAFPAGAFIALLGAPALLWVDAASFAISALLVAAAVPGVRVAGAASRYLRDLVDGLRFMREEPTVLAFLVIPALGGVLIGPLAPVLLPLYARHVFESPTALGVMVSAYGAGGLAGTLIVGWLAERTPRRRVYVGSWVLYAAVFLVLPTLPPLAVAAAVLLLVGACAGAIDPIEQVVRQERAPSELRGRVLATAVAANFIGIPPGLLIAGFLAEELGLRAAFTAFAVANALLALAVVSTRAVRRL